jgi:methylated-DNA-[protein]-cysteine S-methyltransferase
MKAATAPTPTNRLRRTSVRSPGPALGGSKPVIDATSKQRMTIGTSHESILDTAVGPLLMRWTPAGVTAIRFLQETASQRVPLHPPAVSKNAPVVRQLAEYLAGQRTQFDLPLVLQGTPFQHAVWEQLCAIPYGTTRTYGELARDLGMPAASRAVGRAVGSNPLLVVVPCHRVVGQDGRLTGYAGGIQVKAHLLGLEQRKRAAPAGGHDPDRRG